MPKNTLGLSLFGLIIAVGASACDGSETNGSSQAVAGQAGSINNSLVTQGGATNTNHSGGSNQTGGRVATGGTNTQVNPYGGSSGQATSSSGGSTSSPLTGDRQLSSLSSAELVQLNDVISADASRQMQALSKDQLCQFAGIMSAAMTTAFGGSATDTALQQTCAQLVSSCKQDSSSPDDTTSNPPTTADLQGCTVTVSEYQNCAKDSTQGMVTLIQGLPQCSALTVASLTSTTDSPLAATDPASCAVVEQKCPQLAPNG